MDIWSPEVFRVCVNLGKRTDRWREVQKEFALHELEVVRQPGISAASVRDPRGFKDTRRYACSLAKRLAIRQAKLKAAKAVVLFEDDVVFAPDLREKLSAIELPEDWGMFFIGGRHLVRPEPVGNGLVRVRRTSDNHALVIRDKYFEAAMGGLEGGRKGDPQTIRCSDVKLADLQFRIPTYAAYPNLAWQRVSFSENEQWVQSYYAKNGEQESPVEPVEGLLDEMARFERAFRGSLPGEPAGNGDPTHPDNQIEGSPADEPKERESDSPPGWYFLDYAPRRHVLEQTFPLRFYVNLARREDRRREAEFQFSSHRLPVERFPAVDARSARNLRGHPRKGQYGCALSHRLILREAKRLKAPAVLVFEDDVILDQKFRQRAEALALPPDWGLFYYGCWHLAEPIVVSPGIVRVTKALCTHAFAVRAPYYDTVMKAMRCGLGDSGVRACDEVLADLHQIIPSYAVYPNLAWQSEGDSDIWGGFCNLFREDGTAPFPQTVRKTNEEMRRLIESWCPSCC